MTTWKIDNMHSQIGFKVKHLVVTNVSGIFGKFDATMEWSGKDLTDAKVNFSAQTDSISTGNEQRDGHLKTDDFFNSAKYPEIKFESKKVNKSDEHNYTLEGMLTIRDITKPITLNVVYGGTVKNAYNMTVAGFEISGKINRRDFRLKWSAATEAGHIVVSDEVRLDLTAEMIQQN
jgi:polyisoprenoid-binding protein YceI